MPYSAFASARTRWSRLWFAGDGDFWILYLQGCAGVAQGECVANVPLLAYRPTGFHQLQRIVGNRVGAACAGTVIAANVAALGLRFSAVALSAALPQPVLTGALSATASPSCSWTRRSRMRCSMGSSTKVWMMRARSRSQTASHLPTSNNWGAVQFREKHSCALLRFLLCVKTWIIRMLAASMTRCGVGRGSAAPS